MGASQFGYSEMGGSRVGFRKWEGPGFVMGGARREAHSWDVTRGGGEQQEGLPPIDFFMRPPALFLSTPC